MQHDTSHYQYENMQHMANKHKHTYIYIYVYINMHTDRHAYIHAYMHALTHTHTNIHAYIHNLGAKQGGTPKRRTANRPSANLVNQQQPKRTSTQKLQGRGFGRGLSKAWALFKQGGTPERRTANRPSANLVNQQQPKRTSTQKLQGRAGWARFVKGLGAVLPVLSPSV